jgi:hypothetical protein
MGGFIMARGWAGKDALDSVVWWEDAPRLPGDERCSVMQSNVDLILIDYGDDVELAADKWFPRYVSGCSVCGLPTDCHDY